MTPVAEPVHGGGKLKKLSRAVAAISLAGASLFALAPAAQADQCQDIMEGWCETGRKICSYGETLEQKYGVGWYCID
jgi:hypothetical protein